MSIKKHENLEERFKRFLVTLSNVKDIDNMPLPQAYTGEKADYIIDDNIIIEIKSLYNDPSSKIEQRLEPHKNRKEYPVFFGKRELKDILKHLPDGQKINREIFFALTKSIQKALEKADDQIEATKIFLDKPNACGIVILLNEKIETFSPETVAYITRYMMAKKSTDGSIRYKNFQYVFALNEAYHLPIHQQVKALPITNIHGPLSEDYPEGDKAIVVLTEQWTSFMKANLFEWTTSPSSEMLQDFKLRTDDVIPALSKNSNRANVIRSRYRQNRYLKNTTEKEFIEHGKNLKNALTPYFLIGTPLNGLPPANLTLSWINFLEEAELRNFDFKNLK